MSLATASCYGEPGLLGHASLRGSQLALDPLYRVGFERIRPVAFKALERARPFAAWRQGEDQVGPAYGASRSLCLAHTAILPPPKTPVNLNLNSRRSVALEQICAIRSMNMVAIGRLVLTSREHIIALEPLKNGLMGTLLRYPYEVRSEDEYFDDIQDVKVTKDMLDLAKHIVEQKSGEFDPGKFEDRYEAALVELVSSKRNGTLGRAKATARPGTNVVDLMTALQQSLKGGAAKAPAAKGKKSKVAAGQREMLLPISGKRASAKEETKAPAKTGRAASKTRKAG
ncbi:MAG: Ku protein [Tardiphaga sp.]|nr:Ku protein [Tardiphaga sp.]